MATVDIKKKLEEDLIIDEANLVGELKKQKDLLLTWSNRLNSVQNELTKTIILLDRIYYEKYKFYKDEFERALKDREIKIYVEGHADIIKLKEKKREFELLRSTIKGGIVALRTKGKTINTLISLQEKEMI